MSHFQKLMDMGWSHEKILEDYPHLDRDVFLDAMRRWARRSSGAKAAARTRWARRIGRA